MRRCVFCLLVFLAVGAFAQDQDYTLDGVDFVPIPLTYTVDAVYSYFGQDVGSLNGPQDLFIDYMGYLYIADTGNNRIIKTDRHTGTALRIYDGPPGDTVQQPAGIYVDDDGDLYVADTGNGRILHLAADDTKVEQFGRPDSELLSDSPTFFPTKVALSPTGYLYLIKGQQFMVLDAYNNFRGFVGATEVGFSLRNMFVRWFASEEQKRKIRKVIAKPYTNFTFGHDGMIYATSLDNVEGEIKKINSVGDNIYRKYVKKVFKIIRIRKIKATKTFYFGERIPIEDEVMMPRFVDVAVDAHGIVSAVEENTGNVYQYDQEANLLTVFAGHGINRGTVSIPSSVEVDDDGNIYILDSGRNNIQVFKPTRFLRLVHEAVRLYAEGEYSEALNLWNQVLEIDTNYFLAHVGRAKALYKKGEWKESMLEYQAADDRAGYTESFDEYRHSIFRENFGIVVPVIALIFAALIALSVLTKKTSDMTLAASRTGDAPSARWWALLSLSMLVHPRETMLQIKQRRQHLNYAIVISILVAIVAVRVVYIFLVHYPMAVVEPRDANLWLEIARYLLPVLSWIVASFAMTSILEGESLIQEIFAATSFAMMPYVVLAIPLALLSKVLAQNEVMLFTLLTYGIWGWVILLYVGSVRVLNDYSVARTLGVCALSVVAVLIMWAVLLLIYSLAGQLFDFGRDIAVEARMLAW